MRRKLFTPFTQLNHTRNDYLAWNQLLQQQVLKLLYNACWNHFLIVFKKSRKEFVLLFSNAIVLIAKWRRLKLILSVLHITPGIFLNFSRSNCPPLNLLWG